MMRAAKFTYDVIRKVAGLPLVHRAGRLFDEFMDMTKRTPEVQERLLLDQIRRNASGQFGRDFGFDEIKTYDDYRRRMPIAQYDDFEPYIAQVREGNTAALFGENTKILMFAMTSGTTKTPKTIPVTERSVKNYRDGWMIWGIRAFTDHWDMLKWGMRPVLQMASDWQERKTPAGIPCGAITGLTAKMQSPLVRITYCLPVEAARIKSIEAKYYVALRMSAYRDLGCLMAANPSTILSIVRLGDREKETLIRDIAQGTIDPKWEIPQDILDSFRWRWRIKHKAAAKRMEKIVETTGHLLPKDYWPRLSLLANWTGGTMGSYLNAYPDYFGDVPVRDVGLIASEGRMTIPIDDGTPAGVLDIRHNVFEFIPAESIDDPMPETLLPHELREGHDYFVLLTTPGGLYRYNIHDMVRCRGFEGRAPLIEFLNKGSHFSSLTGEKLSEHHVVTAVNAAQRIMNIRLTSFLLLPVWGDPPGYLLLVEQGDLAGHDPGSLLPKLAREVDTQIGRVNDEYTNRLETKRLAPTRVIRIVDGSWADYKSYRLNRSGGTVEQYKQPCLLPDLKAIERFATVDSITDEN
jgi:hypothetical protein